MFPFVVLLALGQSPPPAEPLLAIEPRMQKFVDDGTLSGAVTLVGRKDGVIHHTAVGLRDIAAKAPMTPDAVFRIASMTKPVTAVGLMILVDEGKVNVDDDVSKYLPEFTGQMLVADRGKDTVTLKKPARPVKVRDILTHTSGIAPFPPGMSDVYVKRNRTLAETTVAAGLQPLMFEPGSKWAYCNPGIDAVGRVIEVVSGKPYDVFLKERVFDPLGMVDTTPYPSAAQLARLATTYKKGKGGALEPDMKTVLGLDPETARHPVPAGGLYSTAADLAKLYRMMLHKGELGGKRILSEKAVAEMTRNQTGDLKGGFVDGMGQGFGWAVVKESVGMTEMLSPGTFGHGGAFGTQAWIDPTKDVFAVLLIQRTGLGNSDGSAVRKAFQDLAVAGAKR